MHKWQLFYKIIFPVAKPAVATLIITDFLSTWNEYLLASVIINDNMKKTVPVGIMTFVGRAWNRLRLSVRGCADLRYSGADRVSDFSRDISWKVWPDAVKS